MFDREAMFSWRQEIAADAISEDVVYVGIGDAGGGQNIRLEIDTPAVTGGGEVAVELQHADSDAGPFETVDTLHVSAEALERGGPVLVATLRTGLKDYLRLNYVVTGTVTGFVATAGLLPEGQTNR